MSFSRNCILGTGLFFLLTASCAAVEWHHPLSRDGGGIWQRRIPITVTNPTDRAIKGVPVRIAFGAGGVPLAGMAAESVRVCDSRGQELLFALTDSQALPVSRGPIPSSGFLAIPVECAARQSASSYVYFDNPSAGELPDFLTDRSALANGDLESGTGSSPAGWKHDRLNPLQATRLQPVVRRGGNPACGVAPVGLQPVPLSHRSSISKRVMIPVSNACKRASP